MMLLIKNKNSIIKFNNINKTTDTKYTLLLQNNLTNKVYVFNLEDLNIGGLRYKFNLLLDDDFVIGEYTYYLITNNSWDIIHPFINNIKESEIEKTNYYSFLINKDSFLTVDGFYLTVKSDMAGEKELVKINILQNGLLMYGDVKGTYTQNNKDILYNTYEQLN